MRPWRAAPAPPARPMSPAVAAHPAILPPLPLHLHGPTAAGRTPLVRTCHCRAETGSDTAPYPVPSGLVTGSAVTFSHTQQGQRPDHDVRRVRDRIATVGIRPGCLDDPRYYAVDGGSPRAWWRPLTFGLLPVSRRRVGESDGGIATSRSPRSARRRARKVAGRPRRSPLCGVGRSGARPSWSARTPGRCRPRGDADERHIGRDTDDGSGLRCGWVGSVGGHVLGSFRLAPMAPRLTLRRPPRSDGAIA